MGTEFQYVINPFAKYRRNISFSTSELDDWDYLKRQKGDKQNSTIFLKFEDSMDKLLEKEKLEFIKRTMMTHENIFKHQVRELHQIYNTQKSLMEEKRDASNACRNGHVIDETKGFNIKRSATNEKGQHKTQCFHNSGRGGSNISTTLRTNDEEDHQLMQKTHNPGIYAPMENKSNTDDTVGDGYEACDIDLTLGIGRKKKQLKTEGSSSSSNNNNPSNLPHWLHKSLGSNKT